MNIFLGGLLNSRKYRSGLTACVRDNPKPNGERERARARARARERERKRGREEERGGKREGDRLEFGEAEIEGEMKQ